MPKKEGTVYCLRILLLRSAGRGSRANKHADPKHMLACISTSKGGAMHECIDSLYRFPEVLDNKAHVCTHLQLLLWSSRGLPCWQQLSIRCCISNTRQTCEHTHTCSFFSGAAGGSHIGSSARANLSPTRTVVPLDSHALNGGGVEGRGVWAPL